MQYISIIGLEIHVQLKTKSKMFCRCDADYFGDEPNTHTCPTCLGLPGALPTINEKGVEQTVRVGLAVHCTIPEESKFDRKNYFYPDLVKGYQISQYDKPLCIDGYLDIFSGEDKVRIGITRAHLEEDTAKSIHETDAKTGEHYTLIDCNKSGIPLLEIVSEPDMRSVQEASAYARKIHQIVRYIGASDADMEKGQMRFDINVSVGICDKKSPVLSEGRDLRQLPEKFTPIVEVKNLNSFRALEKSLEYEIARQIKEYEKTGQLYEMGNKETRGWDYDKEVTVHQRSKEEAHDYRYFPEPDLPPLRLESDYVEKLRSKLPELPEAKAQRFVDSYALKPHDAELLVEDREEADWYEQAVKGTGEKKAQEVAKWLLGDITYLLREQNTSLLASNLKPEYLPELVELIESGEISGKIAKDILPAMVSKGISPKKIVEDKGLKQVSDTGELEQFIEAVIVENPAVVEEIKGGKDGAVMFLVGQVMKESKGQANPPLVQKMLREKLGVG